MCTCLVLAFVMTLGAQSSATLGGSVADATGAVLPGVAVSLVHLDRNQTLDAAADSQGRFQFLRLAPGEYRLSVDDARFAPYRRAFTLGAGQAVDLAISLELAGRSASVIVSAAAYEIE
ncbi:MAG: carboxypeptidase-like regulatory domain-containing protein, partial [Bryobacteraceae bacterium]